jgi:hypothetical protein
MLKLNLFIFFFLLEFFRPSPAQAVQPFLAEPGPQDKPFVILGYSDSDDDDGTISSYQNNLLYSLEVKAHGDIELTDDDRDFKSVPEDGYVLIKERNWFTYRELEVRRGASGVEKSFFVQGRPHDLDEETLDWLRERLPDIARQTGLGARYRIERILRQKGVAAAIHEISFARSNRAIQIYARIIVAQPDLSADEANRLIRTVADEMSSSTRLSETLTLLAEKAPQDSSITHSLMRAVVEISSSSKQSATLAVIAEKRTLDVASAVAMAGTIETISSSSAQTDALLTMLKRAPQNENVWLAYLDAVQGVSSSSKQGIVLQALIDRKPVGNRVWIKTLKVIEGVSSSSVQGETLSAFAQACPNEDDILLAFVSAIGYVSSSSQQGNALMALLDKEGLSRRVLEDVIQCAQSEISSKSVERMVTERATKILLEKKG